MNILNLEQRFRKLVRLFNIIKKRIDFMKNKKLAIDINREQAYNFLQQVEKHFGFYLDCISGFSHNYKEIQNIQNTNIKINGLSREELDTKPIIIGKGSPNSDNSKMQHKRTQSKYKLDNSYKGYNYQIALNNCIMSFFNDWKQLTGIKSDEMRDKNIANIIEYLDKIRVELTHRNPLVSDNIPGKQSVESCELFNASYILPAFPKNEIIYLEENDLDAIVIEFRIWFESFKNESNLE